MGDFRKRDREDQYSLTKRCYYCGKNTIRCKVPHPDRYNMDHYDPLALGGSGGRDNGVTSCQACNLDKGVTPGDEYKKKKGTLKGWFYRTLDSMRGRGRR